MPEEGSIPFVVAMLEGFVDHLVQGRSVAYIGAGVSMSANLPSWNNLLASLRKKAVARLQQQDPMAKVYFETYLVELQRNLEIGDWLLDTFGEKDFCRAVKEVLSLDGDKTSPVPSPIHRHLARLPFSMVLTTNYDDLLETAYSEATLQKIEPSILTWLDAQLVLDAMSAQEFKIVHVHGIIDKPESLVLSGSQYARFQHSHPETNLHSRLRFPEVLKWLLKTRTFLFIGASLLDPDLVFYLQEVAAELGSSSLTHYALLPYNEAPETRRRILEANLKIKVIPIGNPSMGPMSKDLMTTALSGVLRVLSARASLKSFELGLARFPTSDDSGFCLQVALQSLLDQAVKITGSFRGDFCLPKNSGSHGSGELIYSIHTKITGNRIRKHPPVPPNSICGIAYYQATADRGVYVKDVEHPTISWTQGLGHYGEVKYEAGHDEVKSELAMLIEADGARAGVLNIESNLIDCYSEEHLEVVRRIAEKAGRLYAAANERQRRARRLAPNRTYLAYQQMRDICNRLWLIARDRSTGDVEVALLVYHADYLSGELRSQDPNGTVIPPGVGEPVGPPRFSFQSPSEKGNSLATRVYFEKRPFAYSDAEQAERQGKLPKDSYPKHLGIRGPLIGFPVSIHGHVSGVVTSWLRGSGRPELDGRDIELFRRAAHVMANCFRFEGERGSFASKQRFESVEIVNDILDCVSQPEALPALEQDAPLNGVGRFYFQEIGSALTSFLRLLNRRDEEFSRNMNEWYGNRPKPTLWISPRRCRCWIRCGTNTDGSPRFLLALQVAIDGGCNYKNQVKRQRFGVVMQPFRRVIGREAQRGQRISPKKQPIEKETLHVRIKNDVHTIRSMVFDNNPHLSFLL